VQVVGKNHLLLGAVGTEMILIGSRALKFHVEPLNPPVDFDFIAYESAALGWLEANSLKETSRADNKIISQTENNPPVEFDLIEGRESNRVLLDMVSADSQTIHTKFGMVPSIHLLFALKKSHRYLKNSKHFWKTARDYHWMKAMGLEVLPEHEEFFKLREKETYNYIHPKLNQSKKNFFSDDNITYQYDHDTIHLSVARNDKPAYEYFKKDGAEVACDKEKFFSCSEEIRLSATLEESYVLALERSQIPHPGVLTPKQSFMLALSKVCSSITSGWFREYSYLNIFKAVKLYDDNYVSKFWKDVESGLVRKL
jgi:hypothetical protein